MQSRGKTSNSQAKSKQHANRSMHFKLSIILGQQLIDKIDNYLLSMNAVID